MAVHMHEILLFLTILPTPLSNGCRSTYPRNPPNPSLSAPMAVYGRAHESYGRARRHPYMTPL
eukprot:5727898-Pyramimonas_sp.AAC.1